MTFKDQVLWRMKAILTAVGASVVALIGWLVQNPDTAQAIQQVIPAPYAQFVPLALGVIGSALLVNHVSNKEPEPTGADEDDLLTTNTTSINAITTEDGVEAGAGR